MKTISNLLTLAFFLIFNIIVSLSFAQNQNKTDSLISVINTSKNTLNRIEACILLGHEVEDQQIDTAIIFYSKAISLSNNELQNEDSLYVVKVKSSLLLAYSNLGVLYQNKGIIPDALYNYRLSLNISKEIGNEKGIALVYNNLGVINEHIGETETALEYYQISLAIRQKHNDTNGIADLYFNIGYIYDEKGDIPKALDYYNKSLEINMNIGNKKGEAECLTNIGYVYKLKGDNKKALEFYNKSYTINKEIGNKKGISTVLNNIGRIYQNSGDIPKAMDYFQKSLEIRKEIGYKKGIATSYNNIGIIYYNLGNIEKALYYFKKSVKTQEEIGNKSGSAVLYSNIGFLYNSMGEISKAIEYYNKALKIYNKIVNVRGQAIIMNNLSSIYNHQGDYTNALKNYKSALWIAKLYDYHKLSASIMNNIANIYINQAKLEYIKHNNSMGDSLISLADNTYSKTLIMFKENNDKEGIASAYFNMGKISVNKALRAKSENDTIYFDYLLAQGKKYYLKSLETYKQINYKSGIISSTGSLAIICNRQGDNDGYRQYAFESYKLSKELAYPELIKNTAQNKMVYHIQNSDFIEADSLALKVVHLNNTAILNNFTTLSESGQEKYFAKVEDDYMVFNSYALIRRHNNPAIISIAYNNAIKNKGLLLKSSTAMRNAILSSNDTSLVKDYYQWILFKKKIAKNYSKGKDTKELEDKANNIEKTLVKKSQVFSDFKKLQNISWKDIQLGLKTDECAIEFIHFKYVDFSLKKFSDFTDSILYCALIITKENQYPQMIPLFEEKQLEEIIGKFGGNNYSYINSIYGKNTKVNKELYNLIWAPIDSFINVSLGLSKRHSKTNLKVFISQSGLLHKISFSAIAKEQNVYLCDAYDIEVKSSTYKTVNSGDADRIHEPHLHTATLFGGINYNTDSTTYNGWTYLKGTKTETQKIDKILSKGKVDVNYFSNTSATEREFKLIASTSNILHIATHGFFYPDPKKLIEEKDETIKSTNITFRGGSRGFGVESFVKNQNPLMRSGLVFAGANDVWSKQNKGNDDDGVLTALEVAHINMRKAELVVMSACETGLGDIKGSEGVYGLQRAFKMAGVNYIVMSLWQVPDKETEEFMTTFYSKLVIHKDLSGDKAGIKKAFNETQKEMRAKYDPYFWAAFVLIE